MTVSLDLTIINKKGLHARPAAKLVRLAASFPGTQIFITRVIRAAAEEEVKVVASSVLGLLMLAADKGTVLRFEASGDHACDALAAITALVEARFEEVE